MYNITKRLFLMSGIALIPSLALSAPENMLKAEYDRILKERNEAPTYATHEMDAGSAKFLRLVKANWEVRGSECPDPDFGKMAKLIGVEESVESVVKLYTHKTPPFSKDDHHRNAKEAVIAATMTIALPISKDSMIYTKEGVAFIKVSDKAVIVFEDTDKGLKRTLYGRAFKAG